MSVANIFNRDVEANKGPRNVFDVGYSTIFSSPCGMILPAYVEDVKQGDKLSLSCSNVCRTRPVNTSAFMAFDERVDFWYVPYYLIWSAYEQWRLGQTFRHSSTSLTDVGKQVFLPSTTWKSVYLYLNSLAAGSTVDAFVNYLPDALRLLDLLNYGSFPTSLFSQVKGTDSLTSATYKPLGDFINTAYTSMDTSGFRFNYFRAAAYQCIYQHGYRNEEYEPLSPESYNVDGLFMTSSRVAVPDNTVPSSVPSVSTPLYLTPTNDSVSSKVAPSLTDLFRVHFKNWRRDLFTSLKPSSGFDSFTSSIVPYQKGESFKWPAAVPSSSTSASRDYWSSNLGSPLDSTNASTPYQRLSVSTSGSVTDAYLFASNIYNLLSQDKFSRSMIYADKNYRDQMKAVFGVYDDDDMHSPKYLGSYSCDVSISDVVATSAGSDAETDPSTSVLGEIAGKGYGNHSGHVFERQFDRDGIVMGVHYIMPRNNYDSYRINRFNTKVSRFDYFYPQFDGLGLTPVFSYERNLFKLNTSNVPSFLAAGTLLGYSPRFAEYKTRQSETHGSFQFLQPDYDWTLSNNTFSVASASSPDNYKISPLITNRLFSVAYDSSIQSDPFICYFSFDVKRISNMEIFGTPSL